LKTTCRSTNDNNISLFQIEFLTPVNTSYDLQ
jgi:hypothetical protein